MNQTSGHISRQRSKAQQCFLNAQIDVGRALRAVVPGEEWNSQANHLRLRQPLLWIPVRLLSVITFCVCHDMNVGNGKRGNDKPQRFRND